MSISLRHQPLLSLPREGCRAQMNVVSIAIVGRSNEPLYVREFRDDEPRPHDGDLFGIVETAEASSPTADCSVRQQFILKEGLERLEHVDVPGFFWRTADATGTEAHFVGCLFPIEDLRVYGYITTTKLKIIAVVEDDIVTDLVTEQQEKDQQIQSFLVSPSSPFVTSCVLQ